MLLVRCEVADHDRRQRMGALEPHEMAGIEVDVDDVQPGAVRDQIAPVLALGRSERRGDDLEVDGVIAKWVGHGNRQVLHA